MTLEDLEKRIARLEAIEEIQQVQATYVNCLTKTDWDGAAECFTKNGEMDFVQGRVKCKEAVHKLLKEVISIKHVGLEGNFVVHPIISVEGDKAKGNWLFYVQSAHNRPPTRTPPTDWTQGYYDIEYEKENGKWKISKLKYRERIYSSRV